MLGWWYTGQHLDQFCRATLMLPSTGNQVRHRVHRNSLPILNGKVPKQNCPVYHQPHGTVLNVHRRLTRKRNCWIKSLFLFSLRTKMILVAWITDVWAMLPCNFGKCCHQRATRWDTGPMTDLKVSRNKFTYSQWESAQATWLKKSCLSKLLKKLPCVSSALDFIKSQHEGE